MRTILKFGLIATCVLTANAFAQDFCNTTTHSGESVEVSTNKVGTIGDVGYELWEPRLTAVTTAATKAATVVLRRSIPTAPLTAR